MNNQPRNPFLHLKNRGQDIWWEQIKEIGTPLILPIDNAKNIATFIWRSTDVEPSQPQNVYIDLYSKTPHPTKQLTQFSHIEGTNIWYWETELPDHWLGSYFLMPVTNQVPPNNPTLIRQWWIKLMKTNAHADPLNPIPPHSNGNGISLSAVCLNKTLKKDLLAVSKGFNGIKKENIWHSKKLNNKRRIWLYRTSNNTKQPLPVILFFDGQYWAESMPIYSALDTLTHDGKLPPAQYIFIDSINGTLRHQELGCNVDFWLAIQDELLPWVKEQVNITDNPNKTLVVGQSLGGISAVFGAFHWPERFAMAISQSGSFWWPNPDFPPGQGELIQKVIKSDVTSTPLNIIIEAGCYEEDMLTASQIMAETLNEKGHCVHYNEFQGGHDWLCWHQRLLPSLVRLFETS